MKLLLTKENLGRIFEFDTAIDWDFLSEKGNHDALEHIADAFEHYIKKEMKKNAIFNDLSIHAETDALYTRITELLSCSFTKEEFVYDMLEYQDFMMEGIWEQERKDYLNSHPYSCEVY